MGFLVETSGTPWAGRCQFLFAVSTRAARPRRWHPPPHRPRPRMTDARSEGQASARSRPEPPRRGRRARDLARSEHVGSLPCLDGALGLGPLLPWPPVSVPVGPTDPSDEPESEVAHAPPPSPVRRCARSASVSAVAALSDGRPPAAAGLSPASPGRARGCSPRATPAASRWGPLPSAPRGRTTPGAFRAASPS